MEETSLNYYRIARAIEYLEKNFLRHPDLEEIAAELHLSPHHFQRIFSEWAGVSPKRFMQVLTLDYLKSRIRQFSNLQDAALDAGLSAQSRVYDLFVQLEAVTPEEYRKSGHGVQIAWDFQSSPFGLALFGVTPRGLCWLSFLENQEDPALAEAEKLTHFREMQSHWHLAEFRNDPDTIREWSMRIFQPTSATPPLTTLVKGTNFQVKVWKALLQIPAGQLTTYQDIASAIGHEKALQAVGSAVGANTLAWIIPCHRVIRKSGVIGEYRWSTWRKKSIIGRELAATDVEESPLFRREA